MNENTGSFRLGLEVLKNIPSAKTRKKNPTAHVYKQSDGSYKFKAIVHEDAFGIKQTRQSFKAIITVVPTLNKAQTTIAPSIFIVLSSIITLLVCTFYVDNRLVSIVAIASQLLLVLMYLIYLTTKNKETKICQ